MESPWKAMADDSRRQILLLLKKKNMTPTEILSHFDFTLPALSTHLRILKNCDLVTEKKSGKNRIYSLNHNKTFEMMKFFSQMHGYSLNSLKEFLENEK
ncbi:MAG: metalloregulator ArsR/SmtB family transcription factor [Nitrosopumilus sp.]|uniref:metalloregulator ArsR/SmtB family transcription factor n=1 Tax=Nitrosopumilus sp. TaxID=2024843 RepID=UPI00292F8027|nr:metalloregulator ArsR/SmtB family transcription factor [Nitrosopumilus sp.]